METTRTKCFIVNLCLAAIASLVFTGCGSKDDPKPAGKGKINMKFTVTVQNAAAAGQVDFQVMAANHDASQYGAPVWKMNGVTQNNEQAIIISKGSFTGSTKTYVFETVKAFDFGKLGVTCSAVDGGVVTLSYKAEVDGKVETSVENVAVTSAQIYIKDFSYEGK
ncbi:hypothetical protein ACTJJ0_25910 [Chitinophaga sp. 22321]|uniref:Lipocalin-like domain-containing protein n=1 Tax=Chitinophaga hostae TaxID=2831022 RepID=A0ABS5J5B6_9BACT|nr:hypothetical protein [Chitinophaga hostae]MBS0030375.1 hypothetical protein [Chitinophaga hostae]